MYLILNSFKKLTNFYTVVGSWLFYHFKNQCSLMIYSKILLNHYLVSHKNFFKFIFHAHLAYPKLEFN